MNNVQIRKMGNTRVNSFSIAVVAILLFAGGFFLWRLLRPSSATANRPNIFVILVDDMGFNDLSLRGSNQYFTPNIDALAFHGIILKNLYVPALCTPSRSALMTGKYPTSIGMHHYVIVPDEPWGLPLHEKIMPQFFQEAGYNTSLFGKWHLGFHRRAYFPNRRGFDHFFGFVGAYVDYWQHKLHMITRNYSAGFDMWQDMEPSYDTVGNYSTQLISDKAINYLESYDLDSGKPIFMYLAHEAPHTANEDDPMQAPPELIQRFNYIQDPTRRAMAAMMTVLDDEVGRFVEALDRKGILGNSIIVFYSDNGAPTLGMHANGGSNYPFRGQKNSPWEGGVRSAGLIWSPQLKATNRVSEDLIYSADWLPTLAEAAGIQISANDHDLDGKSMWKTLSMENPSPRFEVLHNADPIIPYTSYLWNNWKYVNGSVDPERDTWLGDIATDENPSADSYVKVLFASPAWKALMRQKIDGKLGASEVLRLREDAQVSCPFQNITHACEPLKAPCLFDIRSDPCERNNLANQMPEMVTEIEKYLKLATRKVVSPRNEPSDPRCDPALNNGQWTYWIDLLEEQQKSSVV